MICARCLLSGSATDARAEIVEQVATLPVAGITQVTAGCASTNFRNICAQLVRAELRRPRRQRLGPNLR